MDRLFVSKLPLGVGRDLVGHVKEASSPKWQHQCLKRGGIGWFYWRKLLSTLVIKFTWITKCRVFAASNSYKSCIEASNSYTTKS